MKDEIRNLQKKIEMKSNPIVKNTNFTDIVETEIEDKQENRTAVESDLTILREETRTLSVEVSMLRKTAQGQEQAIRRLRDPPIAYYCGYQDAYYTNSQILTYDNVTYSYSNQQTGGLDASTGIFTAPVPGTYSITYSLKAYNNAGSLVVHVLFPVRVRVLNLACSLLC